MSVAYSPAPARIANQIYVQATATKMIARCTQGGQSNRQGDRLGRIRARGLQPQLVLRCTQIVHRARRGPRTSLAPGIFGSRHGRVRDRLPGRR
jgi:hypothetical protein